MVLGHDLHGHETLARVGQDDRDRRRLQFEDREGIDRIAVHPHDVLHVDRNHLPPVVELAKGALLDQLPEVEIGLGANEVADCDRYRFVVGRVLRGDRQHQTQSASDGEEENRWIYLIDLSEIRAGFHVSMDC